MILVVVLRLLDWTDMPFAAAFFAAEKAAIVEEKAYRIAVWAINRSKISLTDLAVVTQRRAKIGYLHAQGGLFIVDQMANFSFLNLSKWRTFEEAVQQSFDSENEYLLRKVTLSSYEAIELLRLLSAMNVTRAHLMPTYDNVTETLRTKRFIERSLEER
jgi:hypothetical protein